MLYVAEARIKMLRKLRKNKKAVTGMVIALVITLVALGVIIPIGLLITTNLHTSLEVVTAKSNETSTAQNVTFDVFENIWTAFSLSALVPIIAVAGLLIAIIVGAFALRRRG